MSPNLPAAPRLRFLSLSAFVILLGFFWYRKKRGSSKIDSGGAVEDTQDEQESVNCEEESEDAPDNTVLLSDDLNVTGEGEKGVEVIEIVDRIEQVAESECNREKTPEPVVEEVIEERKVELVNAESEIGEVTSSEKAVTTTTTTTATAVVSAESETAVPTKVDSKESTKVGKGKCSKSKRMAKKSKANAEQRQKKEGNTACLLEKKLAELDLRDRGVSDDGDAGKPLSEDVAERDSANNSPSEVMLASPSVSGYSDTHSDGSSDSGKGCSEMLTPSRTPASGNSVSGDIPATTVYEFEIPQYLVGRLIGRYGGNIYEIKRATNASIYVKTHPNTDKLKICAVEGTQMEVDNAMEMIRGKFSKKKYQYLTFEQVVIAPQPLMVPMFENYQLYLVDYINNDVILSSLVSAGHFFLQQPTHPTFPSLAILQACMLQCYSEPNQPSLPEGVGAGILCAAPVGNGWYRAEITEMEEGSEYCTVKFVDYGGYSTMPVSSLRQIRADFLNLPFQAAECYLANVVPANGMETWCEEAKELVENLTYRNTLQAQVYSYTLDGIPLIYLYAVVNNEFIQINGQLVNCGFAEWQFSDPVTEEVQKGEGAVGCSEVEDAEPVAVPV